MSELFKFSKQFLPQKWVETDDDVLLYRELPKKLMELLEKYFRLTVEGQEHLPKTGRVLFAANHSGFSGFDAMILMHTIAKHTRMIPRVLTHRLWFASRLTGKPATKLGFVKASHDNALHYLKRNKQVIIFPEGEYGNFKPFSEAYTLQRFKTGFIRLAIETETPIVPIIVIGAEETHINLRQLSLSKSLRGLILPLPLNLFPLPAKWRIVFLPPIRLAYPQSALKDKDFIEELAMEIRDSMQDRLTNELQQRGSVFF